MKRGHGLRAALSCIALFTVVGLGTAAASEDSSSGNWTFRVSQGGPASNFDPALMGSLPQSPAQWATCAKLFNYLDRSGRPRLVPEVARGMPRVSQDGKSYTFRIRPGFQFDNGAPVRAANFAWAINRDLNPQMGSPAAAYLTDIVGARDVIAGKARTASGVSEHGEVLTIRLTRRAPDIVQRLATTYLCSVPTNWPIKAGGLVTPSAGPYFVSHYDSNTVVLEKNRYYHGKRPRGPTRIVWSFNQPFDSIPLQVERGDADWGIIAPAATEAIAKQYPRQFHRGPGAAPMCLALNSNRPLFHDSALRKAVSYAIDRRALAAQWGAFAGHVTDHYIPYDMPGYRNEHVYPLTRPNFRKANALARGHRGAAHAIMYVRSPAPAAFTRAQIVQQDLAKSGSRWRSFRPRSHVMPPVSASPSTSSTADAGCSASTGTRPRSSTRASTAGLSGRAGIRTSRIHRRALRPEARCRRAVAWPRTIPRVRENRSRSRTKRRPRRCVYHVQRYPRVRLAADRLRAHQSTVRAELRRSLSQEELGGAGGTTTQTLPSPTAIEDTCLPTGIRFTTALVVGSIL